MKNRHRQKKFIRLQNMPNFISKIMNVSIESFFQKQQFYVYLAWKKRRHWAMHFAQMEIQALLGMASLLAAIFCAQKFRIFMFFLMAGKSF